MTVHGKGYIPTLDGWRAIAIGGVILCHSCPSTYWTMNGALGVNLFFAISGFLITSRLTAEQVVSLKQFYIRRAFRILPPALTYLAVAAVLALLGVIASTKTDFISCLLFLRNYWGADSQHGWYTGHFWSLCVEEHFYLFWPALLVLAGIRRARWLAPALAASFAIWRSLDLRHGWIATLFHNDALRNFPLRSDYRMDALLWGATLALVAPHIEWKKCISKPLASPIALALLAATVFLNIRQPQSYMVLQAILFPVVVIATVAQPGAWLSQLLESKPLRWIGRLSYSLYLWQQLFFSQWHHGVLQRFPLNLVLALAFAWLSYRFVEQPAIRLGRTLYDKFRSHEFGRIGTRIPTAARTGNCRPELSLTLPENSAS